MSNVYKAAFKNKWLGQPATAKGVIPGQAGLLTPFGVGQPVQIYYMRAQNRSGSTSAVAVVALIKDDYWVFGQIDGSGVYTDDTVDAQDADTNDAALDGTVANAGFVLGAKLPFGCVSADVTTAGAGNTPAATHDIAYWNGSAWTAIAAAGLLVDVPRAADWATGEQLIMFDPPSDWAQGGSGTGVPQTYYNIRVRRTALPTVGRADALARRLYVGFLIASEDAIVLNGAIERFFENEPLAPPAACVAIGLACSTADDGNSLELVYA